MKIRTRLLLFLLPALLGHFAIIGTLLANNWIPYHALYLIIGIGFLTASLTIAAILFLANKISTPIHQLNNSALAMAAGQYGELASVRGPKEIADLANTLNTMSQCLLENINRLKENSLVRERMYGEYECAMLLQHLMLQKNIDECRSSAAAIKSVTLFSDEPRGILVNFPKIEQERFQIQVAEAPSTGFEGMYELLTQYRHASHLEQRSTLELDPVSQQLRSHGPHAPLYWSQRAQQFSAPSPVYPIEAGDFFFVANHGLRRFFKDAKQLQEILAKVLRIFSSEGIETTAAMIQKELAFATKRKSPEEDLHLICFQVLQGNTEHS